MQQGHMWGDMTGFGLYLFGFGLGILHHACRLWDGLMETDDHSPIDHWILWIRVRNPSCPTLHRPDEAYSNGAGLSASKNARFCKKRAFFQSSQSLIYVFVHCCAVLSCSCALSACSTFAQAMRMWARDGTWLQTLKLFNVDFAQLWIDIITPW